MYARKMKSQRTVAPENNKVTFSSATNRIKSP